MALHEGLLHSSPFLAAHASMVCFSYSLKAATLEKVYKWLMGPNRHAEGRVPGGRTLNMPTSGLWISHHGQAGPEECSHPFCILLSMAVNDNRIQGTKTVTLQQRHQSLAIRRD